MAPMIGGVVGALFYWAFVEAHHHSSSKFSSDEDPLLPEVNVNTPEERSSPTRDMEY